MTKYGFSERIGTVNYSNSEEVFLGNDFTTHKNYSDEVAREIDDEVKKIISDAYAEAERLLKENMDILTRVAEALLLVETIDGEQFEALFTGRSVQKAWLNRCGKAPKSRRPEMRKKRPKAKDSAERKKNASKPSWRSTILTSWTRTKARLMRMRPRLTGTALLPVMTADQMKTAPPMMGK